MCFQQTFSSMEPLAELSNPVTPARYRSTGQTPAGVHNLLKNLDSGLRRNDALGLLQEALWDEEI